MKHFWLTIPLALTVGSCLCGFSASAQPTDDTGLTYLCDEGDKLTAEEFQQVYEQMESTADQIDMNVAVWIGSTAIGSGTDYETELFCMDTYEELFGAETDGVFLYLDMSDEGQGNLFDWIATCGMGQFYYTNSSDYDRISEIFSDMNPYLSVGNEDLPGALRTFCEDLEYYREKGVPSDTYYTYNDNDRMYLILEDGVIQEVSELPEEYTAVFSWTQIIVVAALLGVLAFGITMLSIRRRYRFKSAGSLQNYLVNDKVRYTHRNDRFLRTYTSRYKIETESHSGGGGGGGHSFSSSSGGSFGGGGNHR